MKAPGGRSYQSAQARASGDTRTLGAEFLRRVKRHPRRMAVKDFAGELSRIKVAGAARAVIPALGLAAGERRVGVLLPPGRGGTVINVALALAGRTSVNLNYTAGDAALARMCELAGLDTVVSSSVYLERLREKLGGLELPDRVRELHAEDLIGNIDKKKVLLEMARVLVMPVARLDASRPEHVATIIYSSGTTGDPKGIQLTHQQIFANSDSIVEHMPIPRDEGTLLTPLPLFHSFGLVPGLWMALVQGVAVAGQADPFDGAALGKLAAASKARYLIATPTFARGYMRRVRPEQFATLEFAIVGAEKCPSDLHAAFHDKYATPLLEGYGCTELAPAVAINSLAHNKEGSIGQPLPGIEILLMDPETYRLLPDEPGTDGLIIVRSAARMLGYLGRPDLTEAAFVHGGYNTGDIGHYDADGYLHITGRLARFAKMAGEMVPLDTIERALQSWLDERGIDAQVAVAAVPDRKRGERLIAMITGDGPDDPEAWIESSMHEHPPLWRPRAQDLHTVESIPMLGTGKRDLGRIRLLAEEFAGTDTKGRGRRVAESAKEQARDVAEQAKHVAEQAKEGVERLVDRVRHRDQDDDAAAAGAGDGEADATVEGA